MSPRAGCPVCGLGGCQRHRKRRPARRSYSGTAAYRAMVVAVLEAYGDACVYCHEPVRLDAGKRPDALVLAHVIGHDDGGAFELENLRPAHRDCNAAAGRAPIIDA